MTGKIVSEMTYNVSMGTLNPSDSFFSTDDQHFWMHCAVFIIVGYLLQDAHLFLSLLNINNCCLSLSSNIVDYDKCPGKMSGVLEISGKVLDFFSW